MIAVNPTLDLRDQLEDAADVLAFLADAAQATSRDNGGCGLSDRSARGFGLLLGAIELTLLEVREAL